MKTIRHENAMNDKKFSKYVLRTDSIDGKYELLYNTKNDYFLRVDKKDFKSIDLLLNNTKVSSFLKEKNFFDEDNEMAYINDQQNNVITSQTTMMLIIKLTRDCNFRCIYCYEDFSDDSIGEKEIEVISKFIKNEFEKKKIKRLIINWFGGEPTLNMWALEKLSKIIGKLCLKYGVVLISSITTNGFLLDEKLFRKLLQLNIRSFQITIDGPKEVHDKQRIQKTGNTSYDIIKNNLIKIKEIQNEKFAVVLRTNASNRLLDNMQQFETEFLKNFIDTPNFFLDFQPILDYSSVTRLTDLDKILDRIMEYTLKGYKFVDLRRHMSIYESACYAMKRNHYVIDTKCNLSRCTVTDSEFSYIGKIDKDGKIIFNYNNDIWSNARKSDSCDSCKRFAFCGGGICPLYYIKNKKPRCNRYNGNEEKVLKIMDLQVSYDLTLKKRYE